MKRVVLYIDRLVLKGFDRRDRHALAAGLQQELTRMFAEPGLMRQLVAKGDIGVIKTGAVRIAASASPAKVGSHLAGSITQGVKA
ncbi:MAG: uncharacterized protein JWQ90_2997 [Hydrocarboniphaga sp.]|uniref:hypothetical protein n=1 Tax=Hydrocarboniphaga sp. TaxID=2033016 RepID=UPI002636ACD2|nr:hypothetical protein [Hydrocarboniphaga sp.]MDB5970547.1 uncharacterized protein [Hydrocarboniphaga sp.]